MHIKLGVTPNHRSWKEKQILAVDTETFYGKPISLQISDGITTTLEFVSEKNVTTKFCELLDRYVVTKKQTVIYFHNIEFDTVSIFYPYLQLFGQSEFSITHKKWTFDIKFMSSKFFTGTSDKHSFLAIDSMSFFKGSLESLANSFNLSEKKLSKPTKLGTFLYTQKNKKFCQYAKQDAITQQSLGKAIDKIHEHFDIKQSISIANMAQHIFKHRFVRETIQFPPEACVKISQQSYIGGKNAIYTPRGLYKNVYSLDINSAYPYAMSTFPAFAHGKYTRTTSKIVEAGVYTVKGFLQTTNSPYTVIYKNFEKHKNKIIWHTTGYELIQAIKNKLLLVDSLIGYYWKPKNKDLLYSPFAEYVKYFYEKRKLEKDVTLNYAYKILLNSLYGKFIQTTKETMLTYDNETGDLYRTKKAGGMYNPFIASLITGYCRAEIYKLEKKYKSLHTSTDGIFTLHKPDARDGLGGHKIENHGDLLLIRPRLYIHYDTNGQPVKHALHGYRGTVNQLETMYQTNNWTYTYKKMTKVKESLIQNKQVNQMVINKGNIYFTD